MSENQQNDGSRLKSAIQELEERVYQLSLFDKRSEINLHCEELESQLVLTVESAILHLNTIKDEMSAEIESYRTRLLEGEGQPRKQTKDQEKLDQELERLSKEVETYKVKCSASFGEEVVDEETFHMASELEQKAKQLKKEMRSLAFNGSFMRFTRNKLLLLQDDLIGKLELSQNDSSDYLNVSELTLDEFAMRMPRMLINPFEDDLQTSKDMLSALLLLSDGTLAIKIQNRPISIWNPDNQQELFILKMKPEIKQRNSEVLAMVQLSNGHLATGDNQGFVDIWSLEAKGHLTSFDSIGHAITCMRALPNGNLVASACCRIFVWNLVDKKRKPLLIELPKKYSKYLDDMINLNILANGYLACSVDGYELVTVMIWRPDDGKLIKEAKFAVKEAPRTVITSSGDVVTYCEDGIRIFSLTDDETFQYLPIAATSLFLGISEHTSSYVRLVHINDNRYYLFEREYQSRGQCLSWITSYSFSSDGKFIVLGTAPGKVVVWPLTD